MKDSHIDPWGDPQDLTDPRDWTNWSVWQFWDDKYDWRDGEDFAPFDVLVWRDEIIVNRTRGRPDKKAQWEKIGERMMIAEVREGMSDAADWIYLVVIHSEGDEPIARDTKIKRRARNILRNGVKRWPRSGRAAVAQKERCSQFEHRRPATPPVNRSDMQSCAPVRSRFFSGASSDAPRPS